MKGSLKGSAQDEGEDSDGEASDGNKSLVASSVYDRVALHFYRRAKTPCRGKFNMARELACHSGTHT